MENPTKGPLDVLKSLWQLVASPTHKRTLSLLVLLIIIAAIPLTVFIAQKQQEIRQRAAGECTGTLSYTCAAYPNHTLSATWNIEPPTQGECNVYIRDDRGDHRINGPAGSGSCNGSWSDTSLDSVPIRDNGHYLLFVSNGGNCLNRQVGDRTLPCAPQPTSTPTPTGAPTPTPTGGGAPACNPSQLTMSVSPSPATVGASVTFSLSGSQGSTWIGDTWSGGVDCSGAFWGTKTCRATSAGTFTWTHTWKNCAPNNCQITSAQCQKPLNYTIGGGVTPTPTPTPTPRPTATPTPAVTLTPTPTGAPGTARLSFNLALTGVGLGPGDNRNPQKRQRNLTICLYDPATNTADDSNCSRGRKSGGVVTYNETTGRFVNQDFNLGGIISGQYQVFVKTNRYLRRRIPQVITITAGQTTQVPQVTLIVGDSS